MNLFVRKTLNGYEVCAVQQILFTGTPNHAWTSLLLEFSYKLCDEDVLWL